MKKKEVLNKTGWALAIISFFGIILAHPFSGPGSIPPIQFWGGLILNIINLWAGILVIKSYKNSTFIAIVTVAATFVLGQIIARIATSTYGLLDVFVSAIIPGAILFFFINDNDGPLSFR